MGNLAVDHYGKIWYTAGNSLETPSTNGTTHYVVPAAGNGALRTIVSNVVFTQDNSAWFVVSENGGSRIERLTPTGTFQDVTAVTSAPIAQLTVNQNAVWFIQAHSSVGHVDAAGATTLFAVPGATLVTLTTGPDGNVWFTGAAPFGHRLIGKVTPAGAVEKFEVTAPVTTLVAGKDGYLYAGGLNGIWRVSATGILSQVLQGDFNPQSLTSASDGTLWFIDAAHPDRAITRMSGTSLQQYGSGIQNAAAVNSLVAADGTVYFTAVGPSAAWLGKFPTPNSLNVITNAVFDAQLNGMIPITQTGTFTALSFGANGNFILSLTGGTNTDTNNSNAGTTTDTTGTNTSNTSDTSNTTSDSSSSTPSSAGVIHDAVASAPTGLYTPTHPEGASGATANDTQDPSARAYSYAGANRASSAAVQDPGAFEGEFSLRSSPGNVLPPRNVSHTYYYSSTVKPTTGFNWADGRTGDAPSASIIVIPAAALAAAAAPTPRMDIMIVHMYNDKTVAAWNAAQPITSGAPATNTDDWWHLATYVTVASGLQDWVPTRRRFGA